MGVHGLWDLLAPVGRRVSVETLTGKRLAIDASIWMIQFMKAMRDEKGEMVRNAHILGFFRRICKLLYLRTKPVFVFDGGTPALKRRTVIARRRQRDNAQAKIRKTAEKLLLSRLRAVRVKELATDLQKQRQENDVKGKRPISPESISVRNTEKENDNSRASYNQEQLDEMLAASLAAEENEDFAFDASASGSTVPDGEVFIDGEDDDEEDEEIILPEIHGKVDPAVLAALPPSLQLDLLVQMRERLMAENRQKYQKVKKAPASFSELQIQAYLKTVAFRREIDVVRKSAVGGGISGVQTSRIASEANREFIFSSSFIGDKQALTSVGQGRVEADQSQPPPLNFSTESVKKDTQTKSSGNVAGSADVETYQSQPPPLNLSTESVKKDTQTKSSGNVAGSTDVETGKAFPDDVQTYLDERGHLRVSRVRALGIHMTRDLQRNLDMMKEIECKGVEVELEKNSESPTAGTLVDVQGILCGSRQHKKITDNNNDGMIDKVDKTKESLHSNSTSIEISFEDVAENDELENDDDKLFAHLVAGDPVIDFSFDNSTSRKQFLGSDSDVEWEGGSIDKTEKNMVEGGMNHKGEVQWEEGFQDIHESSSFPDDCKTTVTNCPILEGADLGKRSSHSDSDVEWEGGGSSIEKKVTNMFERGMSGKREVEWGKGFQGIQKSFSCPDKSENISTKGALQEEADLQEAIRRSLMDKGEHVSVNNFVEDHVSEGSKQMIIGHEDLVSSYEGTEKPEVMASATNVCQPGGMRNILETNCPESISSAFINLNPDKNILDLKILNQDGGTSGALTENVLDSSDAQPEIEICSEGGNEQAGSKQGDTCGSEMVHNSLESGFNFSFNDSLHDRLIDSGFADAQEKPQGASNNSSCDTTKLGNIFPDGLLTDAGAKELQKDKIYGNNVVGKEEPLRNTSFVDGLKEYEIIKDHLDEEMLFLGKQQEDLRIEQRKLERNAESVSSEMFVECQELLQMFGLPYIIAPMEAEAQCAFMEMSNLVDGVVTDDSDAFLFGAKSVYKNIFDDRKYVETYLMKDIENELGLDQEKLIHMALLLGSDYTEGVSGIGIVNAIEVVNAFPEKDGLREFREWIESPDPSILGKIDAEAGNNSKRKGFKGSENNMSGTSSKMEGNSCDQNVPKPVDGTQRIKQVFMDKHRNVSKNWHIPSNFPSDAVISAYASPQVDKSTELFAWGKPDLHVLRKLCWEKFGWGTTKVDDLLLPVLKEYNKHETQLRLEAFYSFNERFAKIRSKRIKKAVKGITGVKSSELMEEIWTQQCGSGQKRKVKQSKDGASTSEPNDATEQATVKKARGRRASQKNLEQPTNVASHPDTVKEVHVRGKGRGQLKGRGRERNSCSVDNKNEGSRSERDEEVQSERTEESNRVRRSGRLRKKVNYTVSDESDAGEKEIENCPEVGLAVEETFVNKAVGGVDETIDANELMGSIDLGMGSRPVVDETEKVHGTDEMSITRIDDNQNHGPLNQTEPAKDYLWFGGGFCMEEDKEAKVGLHALDPIGEIITEKSNAPQSAIPENHETDPSGVAPRPSSGKTCLSDTDQNINGNTGSNDHPLDDDPEIDSGNCYGTSLRAMPNLRRKKRRT